MAHFDLEAGVNDCLKNLEAPLSRGPVPRWQRKERERLSRGKPLSPLRRSTRGLRASEAESFTPGKKSTPACKTAKKTPHKSPKKFALTPRGDRFIPNRQLTDCEWSHFQVTQGIEGTDSNCEMELETNPDYGTIVAENLGYPSNSKILRFKSSAPLTKEG